MGYTHFTPGGPIVFAIGHHTVHCHILQGVEGRTRRVEGGCGILRSGCSNYKDAEMLNDVGRKLNLHKRSK